MTVAACAALVERGDPDRFAATMTAPPDRRGPLFVLYAFNLEVAKAPWVTEEAMIAEMRLQWWRDVVEEAAAGKAARVHEVAGPLTRVIADHTLPANFMDQMIAARRWDIYKDPFEDDAHLDEYIDQTAGHLMWLAAVCFGAPDTLEKSVRDAAYGAGIASFLKAVPAYVARGRVPLLDGRDAGVAALAKKARQRLHKARTADFGAAVPAIRTAWQADAVLGQALADPTRVANGTLGRSEFWKRSSLMYKTLVGGW